MKRNMAAKSMNQVSRTFANEGVDLASIIIQVPLRKEWKGDEANLEFQTTIVQPLVRAGLSVRAFHSIVDIDGSKSIFIQVFASNQRLLLEAERVSMKLKLSSTELSEADVRENQRLVDEEGMTFDPDGLDSEHTDLHIPRVPDACCGIVKHLDAYEDIWAPYTSDPEVQHLYQVNTNTSFILSEMQALKLLTSIINARTEVENGAGLNLDELRVRKRIVKWFPLHNEAGLRRIYDAWGTGRLPWNIPTTAIKDYFSEKQGFYFVLLKHFAKWLIAPALLGLAVFIHQVVYDSPGVTYLPLYGVLVAVWSTFFMESWKRLQNMTAQQWGMTKFKDHEAIRPEFRGRPIRSFIDGKPTRYSSPGVYRLKRTFSSSVTLTALGAVIVVVGSIFWLRVSLSKQSRQNGGSIPDGWPDYITSIINAVQIQIMNRLYSWMANALTNFENHRTATAYDNSLTLKLALFQSINSYFGLVYIAAIKNNITIDGEKQQCALNSEGEPDCMKELQSQLAILMLTRMVLSTFNDYLLPMFLRWLRRCCRRIRYRKNPEAMARLSEIKAAKELSRAEHEADYAMYNNYQDYLEVMLQFGYVALFVVAFPLAPLVALVNVMLNIYVDSQRMMRYSARPAPSGAQDIGAWHNVFEAMAYASAVTNLTIVVFTNRMSTFGTDFTDQQRLVFFIVAEHVVLLIKYAISTYIPDETFNTSTQLARAAYLVPKHIFHVKDSVIRREDALAMAQEAEEINTPASNRPVSGTNVNGVPTVTNPIRGVVSPARNAVRVAPSWFELTGSQDPRRATPGPVEIQMSNTSARASGASVVPTVVTDTHTGVTSTGYVLTGALPPNAGQHGSEV